MAFIYGWYRTEFGTSRPKEAACFSCGAESQMIVHHYSHIFHIFMIPIFPYKVTHEITCVSCKSTLAYGDMDRGMKQRYATYRINRFPPLWHFSGVWIILGLLAWWQIAAGNQRIETLSRIEKIAPEAVIEYQVSEGIYSTLKVQRVEGDAIYVTPNNLQTQQEDKLINIESPENYSKDTVLIHRDTLRKWLKNDRILGVY